MKDLTAIQADYDKLKSDIREVYDDLHSQIHDLSSKRFKLCIALNWDAEVYNNDPEYIRLSLELNSVLDAKFDLMERFKGLI
jgi:hypothetical protein